MWGGNKKDIAQYQSSVSFFMHIKHWSLLVFDILIPSVVTCAIKLSAYTMAKFKGICHSQTLSLVIPSGDKSDDPSFYIIPSDKSIIMMFNKFITLQ